MFSTVFHHAHIASMVDVSNGQMDEEGKNNK